LHRCLEHRSCRSSSKEDESSSGVKAVLDFKGTPLEQAAKLAEALTAEFPPVREVRLGGKVVPLA
jgi:hypothetical protein